MKAFNKRGSNKNEAPVDEFKKAVTLFKRQHVNPDRTDDLSRCIDFSNEQQVSQHSFGIEKISLNTFKSDDYYQGELFTLREYPGFLYAPGAMSLTAQLQMAHQAVTMYCQEPHNTNIHLVHPKSHETFTELSMWELWKQAHYSGNETSEAYKHHYMSFHKLAWSTMGYHFDWTARKYPEKISSHIPESIVQLSQFFAKASLFHNHDTSDEPVTASSSSSLSFQPTACIVNYYTDKSIMGPHRDDSEYAVSKPIVSFSMGRPAIFLLGGDSKNDPVAPLLVRPGDVMMMGGQSRLNYHCMARLLPASVSDVGNAVDRHQVGKIDGMPMPDISEIEALERYLSGHRININLRQVYYEDG